MLDNFIKKLNQEKAIYLKIKTKTNASAAGPLSVLDDDTIKIAVKSPAKENKANLELIALLAGIFLVDKEQVKIIRGKKEKNKLIKILKND